MAGTKKRPKAFFQIMVRVAGLEPARLTPADFKSAVYTNSTTLAQLKGSMRPATFHNGSALQSSALYNPML